jgi:hypothetical protein
VLFVNLVTDVLPAVAVAVQPPREASLEEIGREGTESGKPATGLAKRLDEEGEASTSRGRPLRSHGPR